MARILDRLQRSENRRNEPNPPALPLPSNVPDAEEQEDDIPFIEVGAPAPRGNAKPSAVEPRVILPIPRPTTPTLTPPPREPEIPYYHIAFQPLPFPTRDDSPPDQRFATELVAFHRPSHDVSEQYRHFLNDLDRQVGAGKQTLLFAGALSGAGTTTIMLNLAVTAALRGDRRIAAVDASFNQPALAERLGIAEAPGVREVLARTVPLAWAIHETGQKNLSLIPAGAMDRVHEFSLWPLVLDQLRQRFDWVLIDGGITAARPEWAALTGTATATYLVLKRDDLERPELNDVVEDIPRHGGHMRGYVLTSTSAANL